MDIKNALELSKELAVKAGNEIMKIYHTDFTVEYKDDKMPLTMADQNANDVIVTALAKAFPKAGILSEESADDPANREKTYCFIVDPLDGTKEFIKKNDEFTVNIALAENGRVVMGVVYLPVKEELYYAAKGHGAFLSKDGKIELISVTSNTNDLRMVVSKSHMSDKEKALLEKYSDKIANMTQAGSSLKGCLVASGEAEVYYRFGFTMEWDTAAMHAVCEEAGAIFKQMDGSDMLYNREDHLNAKGFYVINCSENLMSL